MVPGNHGCVMGGFLLRSIHSMSWRRPFQKGDSVGTWIFFCFFFRDITIGTSCKVFHHGWFERFGPLKAGSWLLVLKNTNFWSTQIEPNQLSATIQSVSSHEEERSLLETSMAPAGLLAIRYIQFTTAKSGWGSGWNVWIPWSDLHWGVETSLTQKSCSQRVPCAGLRRRSMSPTR